MIKEKYCHFCQMDMEVDNESNCIVCGRMLKDECKFCNSYNKTCTHKDNTDIRSRKTKGHLRRMPKRCETKFCPLENDTSRD